MNPSPGVQPAGSAGADVESEHEVQIALLSAFVNAVAEGRPREEQGEILDRLLDYSKLHFLSEELLMRFYSYGGYEAHVREHEQTVERIEALLRNRRTRDGGADEDGLSRADAESLRRTIGAHIREADRALAEFLAQMRASRKV